MYGVRSIFIFSILYTTGLFVQCDQLKRQILLPHCPLLKDQVLLVYLHGFISRLSVLIYLAMCLYKYFSIMTNFLVQSLREVK